MKTTIKPQVLEKLKKVFNSEKLHVLIIEDNSIAAKGQKMAVLTKRPNAVVTISGSYEESLMLIDKEHYDLILLDNSLFSWSDSKGREGITFIPIIKEKIPDVFILFTSTNIEVGDILMKENRVDYYVDKGRIFELFEQLEHESA